MPGTAATVRLEVDEQPAAVDGGVDAVDADDRRQAGHRRVAQDHACDRLLALGHRAERRRLRSFRDHLDRAGVLRGEETLRDAPGQQASERHGAQRDGQRGALVAQHPFQRVAVALQHGVEQG
jgi:hypothetical protein